MNIIQFLLFFFFKFLRLAYIETADQPGLLLEIIQIITDVNVDVESAEIDTEVLSLSLSLSLCVCVCVCCVHCFLVSSTCLLSFITDRKRNLLFMRTVNSRSYNDFLTM